jgi:hypothetical protein
MSRIKAAVVAAVLAAMALFAPSTPAQAYDSGNGNWTCDYYEICFNLMDASVWDTQWGIGHTFYYGNMYHDQYAECDTTGWEECTVLMDSANGFWNRDSTCSVTLWDVDGYGNWYKYGTYARGYRGNAGQYRNNGHSRC